TLDLGRANHRAEANFRTALAAINRMLTRVGGEELAEAPEMERVRRDLLTDARDLLAGLQSDPGQAADPAILEELALAHRHLARIHDLLGEPDRAEAEYRRAL